MTIEFLTSVSLIVWLAYTIYGITGFGSTLIAIPLLAHFIPLTILVPSVLLLDLTSSVAMGLRFHSQIDRSEVVWIVPFMLAGVAVGTGLLLYVPAPPLLIGLGIFIVGFGLYSLHGSTPGGKIGRLWCAPAGFAGGTMGGAFGVGGPFYVMYLSRRIGDKTRLRSSMSAVFVCSSTLRFVLLLTAGLLLQREVLLNAAVLLPAMALGLWTGNRLHHRVSHTTVMRLVGALLVVAGGSLLTRAI